MKLTLLFLAPSADGIIILLNFRCQIRPRKIIGIETLLPHHPLHVGLPQHGAADGMAVAAPVAGVVLDVVHRVGVGVGDQGLGGSGGGAEDAVLGGFREGGLVLGVGAWAGDLPRLLDVAS